MTPRTAPTRTLAIILGDQLDASYPEALGLDRGKDTILMVEVRAASMSPVSHVQRTVLFLAAMRHHAEALRDDGWRVDYISLLEPENTHAFGSELGRACERHDPSSIACIEPGSHALRKELQATAKRVGLRIRFDPDPHFTCSLEEFESWAAGRKELTLEYFYRERRKALGMLVDSGGKPEGGEWNFDKQNRKSFKAAPTPPAPTSYSIDETTRQVAEEVASALPDLPGSMDGFNWPVARRQAFSGLHAFIKDRLPRFGDYQDAMWAGEHTLFHSLLSPALNLKLLNPREVCSAALAAYEDGEAPINAVEGFIRQIIGWREFVRGVYFHEGGGYEARNGLDQHGSLPEFYWSGDTDMRCMSHALRSVLDLAYGHHIARLMLTGNFALIAGVDPGQVNDWYLGMYADAVEWVTAPNTIGMAMHADGGVVGTKPYAASGKYIKRMGNYCKQCPYDVERRAGDLGCPFNTFYWDFLARNRERFKSNRRMAMVLKNLERISEEEITEITVSARKRREQFGIGSID